MTFTLQDLTNLYVDRMAAHRIKRNDHSCFHNCLPSSKTKLQLKHLCFGGAAQLAYSVYRENRL